MCSSDYQAVVAIMVRVSTCCLVPWTLPGFEARRGRATLFSGATSYNARNCHSVELNHPLESAAIGSTGLNEYTLSPELFSMVLYYIPVYFFPRVGIIERSRDRANPGKW